jgi:hypothetical protein
LLVIDSDKLPVVGFHLSNSFQKATENYPLLVTPIPADVLLKVEQYKSDLVLEANAEAKHGETEVPSIQLLFDSTVAPATSAPPQVYDRFRFLERHQAGDVLSHWTGDRSLAGLSGEALKTRLVELELIKDGSLAVPEGGLRKCLDHFAENLESFKEAWEVLGELLAHSNVAESRSADLAAGGYLQRLAEFLEASFRRPNDQTDKEIAVLDHVLFRKSLDALLHGSHHPHHLLHHTKYVALSWPEFFAVRFLWWYAPCILVAMAESQIQSLADEPGIEAVVQLSLLGQIASEMSIGVEFDLSDEQRDCLLQSGNSLFKWLGVNAIEKKLEEAGGFAEVSRLLSGFASEERVQLLGWMVQHAARDTRKVDVFSGLVAALHDALPAEISADELARVVNSMRGHMTHLTWAEPWLFRDVVYPLIEGGRASIDDACKIWTRELVGIIEADLKSSVLLFDGAREGQTTNAAAFLFAGSTPERRVASLKLIERLLDRQGRVIQQPLASTSDWSAWNAALVVSMWILAFSQWARYYLRKQSIDEWELDELFNASRDLALIRPLDDWRAAGPGKLGDLAAFYDQAQELLVRDETAEDAELQA